MPMYEVELRRRAGDNEFRLTDRALAVGDELTIVGRRWRVETMELPEKELRAVLRYVCHELAEPRAPHRNGGYPFVQ